MGEIREAQIGDAKDIAAIYNYYIENSAITFDEKLWDENDAIHKLEVISQGGYPFFVYVEEDKVVGYCYLSSWNYRDAYRTTAESTVYVAPNEKGRGIGLKLMKYLLENIDKTKYHTLIACITIPNDPSISLHERLGFKQASKLHEVGFKHDKWQSVGHWQLVL